MRKHVSTLQRLKSELAYLDLRGENAAKNSNQALGIIKKALASIEMEILKQGFPSIEDEIFYFKEIKPPICALQIAYGMILQLEQMRPFSTKDEMAKAIKKSCKFLKMHFEKFSEFIAYYNTGIDTEDYKYFLRENKCILAYNPLLSAQALSTGYDVIVAYMLAYRLLIENYDIHQKDQQQKKQSTLKWSGDKVAFVELISGLYSMRVVSGSSLDLKSITMELSSIFDVDIKDIYGKRKEIKLRKGERFKFLRQMLNELEKEFDDNDDE